MARRSITALLGDQAEAGRPAAGSAAEQSNESANIIEPVNKSSDAQVRESATSEGEQSVTSEPAKLGSLEVAKSGTEKVRTCPASAVDEVRTSHHPLPAGRRCRPVEPSAVARPPRPAGPPAAAAAGPRASGSSGGQRTPGASAASVGEDEVFEAEGPRYKRLVQKTVRWEADQLDRLMLLAHRLQRLRSGQPGERLTVNSLVRVAVDLLLEVEDHLAGLDEAELRASMRAALATGCRCCGV